MGARDAGYVLLRLPLEVRELFAEWPRADARRGRARASFMSRGLARADDRVWPLWVDDRAQVRGGSTTWPWAKPRAVALRFIPAARRRHIALGKDCSAKFLRYAPCGNAADGIFSTL